jgi:phage terminase large subunit-like protein
LIPGDPADFIENTLINPETLRPFILTPIERAFLRHAFELTPDGRLTYPELVFSAPKKSGKTGFAAMLLLYVVRVLGGRYAEGIVLANDLEQAEGRVFQAATRIVEASPLLSADTKIRADQIEFLSTGSVIYALSSDYASAAGANPTITVFDELWGYTSENSRRLWDEMVPPPTRQLGCRLTVTYAGYEGESKLLEELHKRGLRGEQVGPALYAQPGMLMLWTHEFTAPWQDEAWREQMRETLRPNAYLRLIENRWVTTESTFVEMEWWDGCTNSLLTPVLADRRLPVWVGVDASTKRDSTAIVACTYDRDAQKVRLVFHRVFQPSPNDPLKFEETIEATVLGLMERFGVREVRYDPWQMQAVAQRLIAKRVPMIEFNQTPANLTEASQNLYELVKGRNLSVYPDEAMRLSVQRTVAIEGVRGWRIAKEKAAHKIDVVVALAQAALGAVGSASQPVSIGSLITDELLQRSRMGSHADVYGRRHYGGVKTFF